MDVRIAAAGQHRLAHRKNPLRRGHPQGPIDRRRLGWLIGPVATPAGMAGFQGAQRLLKRLLKATADRHRLSHRLH